MATAVVFDFDGVLADSEPLHLAACQEVFASVGVELTREDCVVASLTEFTPQLIQAL
jgi:beta-phosphoglucomutase-like phosphatase (HAD superfamily)